MCQHEKCQTRAACWRDVHHLAWDVMLQQVQCGHQHATTHQIQDVQVAVMVVISKLGYAHVVAASHIVDCAPPQLVHAVMIVNGVTQGCTARHCAESDVGQSAVNHYVEYSPPRTAHQLENPTAAEVR